MLFLLIPFLLAATPGFDGAPLPSDSVQLIEELQMLDDLIEATQDNLAREKQLRQLVLVYQEELALYIKNSTNKDLVLHLAKTAYQLLNEIKDLHLIESFQPSFISELTLFSQIAQKRGIPKP